MSLNMPLVVIGLPIYNGEKYIRRVIELLLGQSYQNVELCISDNASTDGTGIICEEYSQKDPRIKYFRQPINMGGFWNFHNIFNTCLYGEYFMFAAHDDEWSDEYIQNCVNYLETHPNVICCSALTAHYQNTADPLDASAHSVVDHMEVPMSTVGLSVSDRLMKYINEVKENSIFYGVFKSQFLENITLKNFFGSDWLFMLEVCAKGEIHTLDQPLFRRRMGGTSQNAANILSKIDTSDAFMLSSPYLYLFNQTFSLISEISTLSEKEKATLNVFFSVKYFKCYWDFDQQLTEEKLRLKELLSLPENNAHHILLMPDWDNIEKSWKYELDACFSYVSTLELQDQWVWLYVDPKRLSAYAEIGLEGMLMDYFSTSSATIHFEQLKVIDFIPTYYLDVIFSLIHAIFDCKGAYREIALQYKNRYEIPLLNEKVVTVSEFQVLN